jgi:hypothetical protein
MGPAVLGAAQVDAILPVLLILWSEAGPLLIREFTAATQPAEPNAESPNAPQPELIEGARALDASRRVFLPPPASRSGYAPGELASVVPPGCAFKLFEGLRG